MPTIELSETQQVAYTAITEKQLQIQNQMVALQQELQRLQGSIVNISQEVFAANDVAFETVDNPVLSDDKTTITYEVKSDEGKVLVPEDSEDTKSTSKSKSKAD